MARKARTPWYTGCQFVVITPSELGGKKSGVYEEVYCARSRKAANTDAKKWQAETGKPAFVIPGSGHKTRRGLPGGGHPPTYAVRDGIDTGVRR